MDAQTIPAIGERWPGIDGVYAGVSRGEDGQPDGYIILLNARPNNKLNHADATAWAEGLGDGARLPTRSEAALLYANLQDRIDSDDSYWTSTLGSYGYAWFQDFYDGDQDPYYTDYEGRAVAVRRIPVDAVRIAAETLERACDNFARWSPDDDLPDAVVDAVAEAIGGAYDCMRVWEAWSVGTMGPDDFQPVADDAGRVAEIARAALEAAHKLGLIATPEAPEQATPPIMDPSRDDVFAEPEQAAQPADVAQTIAWARVHPDGSFAGDLLPDSQIEDARKRSGAWVPLTRGAPADVARLVEAIDRRFRSSNGVAVERAVVPAAEWYPLCAALAAKGGDHA